jgi:predicted nucleic acid-binding Zn ribbon protein
MLLGWLGSNCWTASLPWLGDEPHEKSDPPALDRGPFLATSRRRRQSRDVDVEQHPGQLKLELRASPRVCPVCAAYLDERRPDAVYCSDTCRSAARDRQRAARRFDPERPPCPMCGTSMAGRRYGAVYCSPTCRVRAWRRRGAAVRPMRSDPPLHLAPVRQPVLRVPLSAALALDLEDVAGDRAGAGCLHAPRLPRSRDIFRDTSLVGRVQVR